MARHLATVAFPVRVAARFSAVLAATACAATSPVRPAPLSVPPSATPAAIAPGCGSPIVSLVGGATPNPRSPFAVISARAGRPVVITARTTRASGRDSSPAG